MPAMLRSFRSRICRRRKLKKNAMEERAEREGHQSIEVTEYDELLVRRLIEKVTVYDERFEVEFKSGRRWMWGGK